MAARPLCRWALVIAALSLWPAAVLGAPPPLAQLVARQTVTSPLDVEPNTIAEPAVAADPQHPNRLVVAFQEGRTAGGASLAAGYARSADGGQSWRTGALPDLTTAVGGPFAEQADNVVAFDPGGAAYVSALAITPTGGADCARTALTVSRSDDGGTTFGAPVVVHEDTSCTLTNDKDWMVVDNGSRSPHRGRLYLAFDQSDATTGNGTILLSHSDDRGQTWSPSTPVSPPLSSATGAQPLVQPDGRLTIVYTATDANSATGLFAQTSGDGGMTFSAPLEFDTIQGFGSATYIQAPNFLPPAAVDPDTGRLYVAWQDNRLRPTNASESDILLSSSTDGATWSAPVRVNQDPLTDTTDHVEPSLAAWAGRVVLTYLTTDASVSTPTQLGFNVTASQDLGASFGPECTLGPTIDLTGAAKHTVGTPFLGDYFSIAAGPSGIVPVWTVASAPPQPSAFDQALWAARIPSSLAETAPPGCSAG